jgi:hypothetical protein
MSGEGAFNGILDMTRRHNRAAINAYFGSLPKWPYDPKPLTTTKGETQPKAPTGNDATTHCKTTRYTLAGNPDQIVIFQPDVQVLWPGALIQGNGLLSIGSLRELPIRERAPIPVSVRAMARSW